MEALKELRFTAGTDVDLAGFDDIDLCEYLTPALTSVSVPLMEIGQSAAQKVIGLIGGNDGGSHREELPCRLIGRDTFVL